MDENSKIEGQKDQNKPVLEGDKKILITPEQHNIKYDSNLM